MEFKYEIGEIVQLKLIPNIKIIILERYFLESSGGIQLVYLGRTNTALSITSKPEQFKEMELEKTIQKKSKAGGTE